MTRNLIVGLMFVVCGSPVLAQPPQPSAPPVKLQPGHTVVPGQCLTKEELDLIGQLDALKRPTLTEDDQKPFDPNYFVGRWSIDWNLPESPLGTAGEMSGVETVRRIDDCAFESTIQGKSDEGPFEVKTVMVYDRKAKYLVRTEQDSRGFQLLKVGAFGGDLGGYFTHFWDAPPFAAKGKKVRLKGTTFLSSPNSYRLRMQMSVDDGPFVNYGTTSWRRESRTP